MTSQSSSEYPNRHGHRLIQQLFKRSEEKQDECGTNRTADTFRQLKQLREMLKGGQITGEEYEAIKFELLNR
jgi:hypothetical protein